MLRVLNPNLTDIKLSEIIGLDTEFNDLRPIKAKISVISICTGTTTYVLEVQKYTKKELTDFLALLVNCKIVIAHNAKADQLVLLSNFGIVLRNWFCTMIGSQLIDNGRGQKIADDWWITKTMVGGIFKMKSPHGLISCLKRYLGIDYLDTDEKKRLQRTFIDWKGEELTQEQLDYSAGDVESLIDLYEAELVYLKERELLQRAAIKFKLIPVLSKCELKGVLIDITKHKQNIDKWVKKVYELECQLDEELRKLGKQVIQRKKSDIVLIKNWEFQLAKSEMEFINHSSDKQVLDIFDELGCIKPRDAKKETKSGFSVSDDNLKIYKAEYSGSKLINYVNILFDYKVFCKKVSTYGEKLLSCVDDDGRLRTNYGLAFTDTLRLNSSSILSKKKGHSVDSGINLSNIPKDNDIRNIVISDPGFSFTDCDMAGQEAILAASYSKDPLLFKAYTEGFDLHSHLATESFSIIFNQRVQVTNEDKYIEIDGKRYNSKKELRQNHKNVLFSLFYGGGKERVYEYLSEYIVNHNPPEQGLLVAEKVSKKMKEMLPVLMNYLKSELDFVQVNGFSLLCKLGGKRYYDNVDKMYGEILNARIQGSGSSALDLALIKVDTWLVNKSKEFNIPEQEFGWLSMSIYDQVLVSINDKYLYLKDDIQKIMADSLTFFLDGLQGSSEVNIIKRWQK